MDKFNKDNWVVQANKLIEAKGRLGSLEQDILAILISDISPEDDDFKIYDLKIKELAEFSNIDNTNAIYRRLLDAVDTLGKKTIKIEEIDKESGRPKFLVSHLISSASHIKGSGRLEISIDPKLKPYLIAIKGVETPYTKYRLKFMLQINSSYAKRLYELLTQYKNMNPKKREFSITEIRKELEIKDTEYERFTNFEKRVLEPATSEINEKSDLSVYYEKVKKGRTISKIVFHIERKYSSSELENEEIKIFNRMTFFNTNDLKEKSGLKDFNINEKQFSELYSLACEMVSNTEINPLDYIRKNYEYVSNKKNVRNHFSYFKKVLEVDGANVLTF